MSGHVLNEIAENASALSFARLDTELTGPPAFLSAGVDGSLTVVARGDHIPPRYRRAMHGFRFAQYWRLGYLDADRVDAGTFSEEVQGYAPDREYHSIVVERHSGRAVAYVYLALPDPYGTGEPFALEKEYDVAVGTTIGAGVDRSRVWEAKRLVRRVGMPWSGTARNGPWWAMLGLSFAVVKLYDDGVLARFVADGSRLGSPRMFQLLGFRVAVSSQRPKPANANGRYGPMWRQDDIPVPYVVATRHAHESHLREVELFLQRNRDLSVRKRLSEWSGYE